MKGRGVWWDMSVKRLFRRDIPENCRRHRQFLPVQASRSHDAGKRTATNLKGLGYGGWERMRRFQGGVHVGAPATVASRVGWCPG